MLAFTCVQSMSRRMGWTPDYLLLAATPLPLKNPPASSSSSSSSSSASALPASSMGRKNKPVEVITQMRYVEVSDHAEIWKDGKVVAIEETVDATFSWWNCVHRALVPRVPDGHGGRKMPDTAVSQSSATTTTHPAHVIASIGKGLAKFLLFVSLDDDNELRDAAVDQIGSELMEVVNASAKTHEPPVFIDDRNYVAAVDWYTKKILHKGWYSAGFLEQLLITLGDENIVFLTYDWNDGAGWNNSILTNGPSDALDAGIPSSATRIYMCNVMEQHWDLFEFDVTSTDALQQRARTVGAVTGASVTHDKRVTKQYDERIENAMEDATRVHERLGRAKPARQEPMDIEENQSATTRLDTSATAIASIPAPLQSELSDAKKTYDRAVKNAANDLAVLASANAAHAEAQKNHFNATATRDAMHNAVLEASTKKNRDALEKADKQVAKMSVASFGATKLWWRATLEIVKSQDALTVTAKTYNALLTAAGKPEVIVIRVDPYAA